MVITFRVISVLACVPLVSGFSFLQCPTRLVRSFVPPVDSFSKTSRASVFMPTRMEQSTKNTVFASATPQVSQEDNRSLFRKSILPRIFVFTALFFSGYRLGVNTGGSYLIDSTTGAVQGARRRFPLLSTALIFLILRDLWRSIPEWAKPRLVKRLLSRVSKPFGKKVEETVVDADDMADFDTLAGKLNSILKVVRARLSTETQTLKDFNPQVSFLALIQLVRQLKKQRASERDRLYASCGVKATKKDLEGLDMYMDMAQWAYDEEDRPLKELLNETGYSLLKHDTTVIPGYLGHYVALSQDPKNKVAVIGVKGTSGFEDLVTDMCGTAISYNLPEGPFVSNGETEIRCHEGILISSRRLADDLQPFVESLLLPQEYKIMIVGHSLGAASAAMLGIFLRSRISKLRKDDTLLQVLAFASPPNLDLANALDCRSFCITIVNNCDVIPRCNLSPLLVTVEVLKVIHQRLRDKGLVANNLQTTIALLRQLKQGTDGDMLLSASEFTKAIDDAVEKIGWDDEEHLYVPGKVIIMYDLWEKEVEQDLTEIDFAADEAVITDGTAKVLRYIEFDERMVEDHLVWPYGRSLGQLLNITTD